MTFGLVSFGDALGDPVPVADIIGDYTEDTERILSYGFRNMLRCAPEIGLTDLAVMAGREALAGTDIRAADLDLVVLAITDIAEYHYWDAAASVAHRLGASRAEAVLLTQACTTGVLSLDAVAGKFATHPRYQTALVLAANRTCEPYWNRLNTLPLVFSDGAAAAVAVRDHTRLRWQATEVLTDGRFADLFRQDAGGTAIPFGGDDVKPEMLRTQDVWGVMEFFGYDADKFGEFVTIQDERTRQVVAAACASAGTEPSSLAKLILLNDNRQTLSAMADLLGVPVERTNLALASEYGHLGAADQLFCLGRYHAAGELAAGDRVAITSHGRGMHWACTVLQA